MEYRAQLDHQEKELAVDNECGTQPAENNKATNEESDDEYNGSECAQSQLKKKNFQKIDGTFKKMYDRVVKKMWKAAHSSDPAVFETFLKGMEDKRHEWDTDANTDHFGRTILHAAVEESNVTLVKTLIHVGVNINCLEGCGASPLTLAVPNGNEDIAKILWP